MAINLSQPYNDFDIRFIRNPINNDVVTLSPIDSIKQSVKLLILTPYYSRPYQPYLGTKIKGLLFGFFNSAAKITAIDDLKRYLQFNEPRISVQSIDVVQSPDQKSISIVIDYLIVGQIGTIRQVITLKRIR